MKKIIYTILFFIVGFIIAFFTDSFFTEWIRDLFQWSTDNLIQYRGKSIYFFTPIFSVSLGVVFSLFYLANCTKNRTKIIINVIICISIFLFSIAFVSSISAILKITTCTNCQEVILYINYYGINYSFILTLSSVLAISPSLMQLVFNKKNEHKT